MGRNHRGAQPLCKPVVTGIPAPTTPTCYHGPMEKVNLAQKFSAFSEHWRPKVVGELNGQEVKLVKFQGVFPWHHHEQEDELFLVWRGRMRIEFRERVVELNEGE